MNPAEFSNIAAAERSFWWYRGMREILFDTLDRLTPGRGISRVLETGCGTGATALDLTESYGWQVIGLDASPIAMQWLRSRGLRALQGDISRLPVAAACCDAVVSCDVLPHLAAGEEAAAFSECARVIRPGGLLILRVAAFKWLRSRHSIFVGERQRFTRSLILELARASGFQPLRCTYLNCLALPGAWAKFRLIEPLFNSQPASGVGAMPAWLDWLLLSALRAERAWLKRGHNLPIGQSILLIAERLPDSRPS